MPAAIDLNKVLLSVSLKARQAKSDWLLGAMKDRFPLISSLVESGQSYAAFCRIRAFGIHLVEWPDGTTELRCNREVVAKFCRLITWNLREGVIVDA